MHVCVCVCVCVCAVESNSFSWWNSEFPGRPERQFRRITKLDSRSDQRLVHTIVFTVNNISSLINSDYNIIIIIIIIIYEFN